jgi:hypothetical protein
MEIWSKIRDYPNYEISNIGRVKSINYSKERILKLQNMNGYDRVGLSINGVTTLFLVHRLVALAFIDNVNNHSFINHINGIKNDNRVENLEWCTSTENLNHALVNNLRIMPNGEKHHNSKLTETQVLEIRKSNLLQKELTKLYNVKQPLISAIINGKKWKHI